MTHPRRQPVYLKDYCPPDYLISEVALHFDLTEEHTHVKSRLQIRRRGKSSGPNPPLCLNGERLRLISVKVNGQVLAVDAYELTDTHLVLPEPPAEMTLEIETQIEPQSNLTLEGLYKSGGNFCTQNESEGFRKITYYLDRPDVLAKFTTTITADKKRYPVLLSNGNPTETGHLNDGRHYAVWQDPFPKPCYLFALVAGDLAEVRDQFKTQSGRQLDLRIYVPHGKEDQCAHAMESLKNAMRWDEKIFGLECDLNTYMIVAVDDFNFGAMENKGLNIFNSQCVLAKPESATDGNYEAVESVVGHEYFHNWTGNRVTCRDWFQITLKEGLTVFREQEFSGAMGSLSVKRIGAIRILRDHQFVEDAGPNAHPIRPPSYLEINNFYTTTIYNKGTEVIRMIDTLIGRAAFCRGITKYFELYDGQAVTTDDFLRAMELASGLDLTQFKNWYDQAGTPVCRVGSHYDAAEKTYRLDVAQQPPKKFPANRPYHFPLSIGLLGADGQELPLELEGDDAKKKGTTRSLLITKPQQSFVFRNVSARPVPSLLRNFSAPVWLEYDYSVDDLKFLLAYDRDDFVRYDAGQRLATMALNRLIEACQNGGKPEVEQGIVDAFGRLIRDQAVDPAFKAEALIPPSVTALTEPMEICDFDAVTDARDFFLKTLAAEYEQDWLRLYHAMQTQGPYKPDGISIGKRTLKHRALAYLMRLERPEYVALAMRQFEKADNMTDQIGALSLLCDTNREEKQAALWQFYERWKKDGLVMNKWFAVQAGTRQPDALEQVQRLSQDPAFDLKNPNKVRSLFGVYSQNLKAFHRADGAGYAYLADRILEIDRLNPSAASHLAAAFKKFAKLDADRKAPMEKALIRILALPDLSPHTYEIASKILGKTEAKV
jgi:aminopeptidase N